MNRILSGSRAFFEGMPYFKPHDSDYVEIYESQDVDFTHKNVFKDGKDCVFQLVRHDADECIRWALEHERPMSICHYMVPDICNELGITIEHIAMLRPLRDNLDYKHQYLGIIFDAYIENNAIMLTDEQRYKAYIEYKRERQKKQ